MNYFELFDIPFSLKVDKTALSRKYFELQKLYHPDQYANATPEEQEKALERSSMANMALKTFRSEDATIKYALQLRGMLEEEEKFQLPQAFLMEVMELNEMRMDGAEAAEIRARVQQMEQDIYETVRPIIEGSVTQAPTDEQLQQVKTYYYQKKYLDRLTTD